MSRRALSELEVINLVTEAQEQLDEYLQIAELSKASAISEPFQPTQSYKWDSPLGLVICESDVNGFMVRTPK